MDSSSNSYKEIKTIGIIQAVHVGILVGLCFINKSLVLFNPYTVIFWVLGPVVVGLYLITALKDPGYISINTQTPTKPVFSILNDENPSIEIENVVTIKDENAPSENLNNLSKENLVKTAKSEQDLDINIRICIQCKINQPYRSKHCRECKKCVALYDHHCPWIHGCVGQRNRIYFFWYLWFQCIELWYGGYFCVDSFIYNTQDSIFTINLLIGIVLLFFISLFGVMVTCLLFFHILLASGNFTTWEYLSWNKISYLKSFSRSNNPFSKGCYFNLYQYCCERFPSVKVWDIKTSGQNEV